MEVICGLFVHHYGAANLQIKPGWNDQRPAAHGHRMTHMGKDIEQQHPGRKSGEKFTKMCVHDPEAGCVSENAQNGAH